MATVCSKAPKTMENRSIRRMQARFAASPRRRDRRAPLGFVIGALAALAMQILVVQTHVQKPAFAESSSASLTVVGDTAASPVTGDNSSPDNAPAQSHAIDCALCHQAHTAGQYFAPSAALFALPGYANVRRISYAAPAHEPRSVSHAWHGRAPPIA